MRKSLLFSALFLSAIGLFGISVSAQGTGVKTGPLTITNASSGAEMYNAYCAVCHGKDGKGTGPAATELKKPPSDLTLLTKLNKGKFPSESVMASLRNGPSTAKAHGTADMPVWGVLFTSIGDPAMATQRIFNLTKYLEGIQAK